MPDYHKIYTFGYANFTIEQLKAKAVELKARVIDTRFRAASRLPEWNKSALFRALNPEVLYFPAGAWFGNVNYKSNGPIQLANPNELREPTLKALEEGPIILLCQCWSFATCHRSEVAKLIQGWTGSDIIHLIGKDLPKKVKPPKGDTDTMNLPF
jgi:hypothetical protein